MVSSKKVAEKYAKALFDTTHEEAHALKVLSKEADMAFFQNPFIEIDTKKAVLKKAIGSKYLLNFLELLIKNKRFQDIKAIAHEYQTLVNESNKALDAKITFAEEVDEDTKRQFKEKLEQIFKREIRIIDKVDKSLLGGFILRIEGKIIDMSIRGKLAKLKERRL